MFYKFLTLILAVVLLFAVITSAFKHCDLTRNNCLVDSGAYDSLQVPEEHYFGDFHPLLQIDDSDDDTLTNTDDEDLYMEVDQIMTMFHSDGEDGECEDPEEEEMDNVNVKNVEESNDDKEPGSCPRAETDQEDDHDLICEAIKESHQQM
ncbi:hypothetical protein C0J52_09424 [Blattella germanica]|nr:hypothetical protein C0J52_09424 [Blattella germanica]